MSIFRRCKIAVLLMLFTVVSACGGGDLSGGTNGEGEGTGEENVSITTVALSISHTEVSAANPATITATVTVDDVVQPGKVVEFSTTLGILNPESGTALTDENGVATISIYAGTIEGAGEVTANALDNTSSSIGFSSLGDGTEVAGKLVALDISSINVSSSSPAVLTSTVTHNGSPVEGEVVTFTTSLGILDPISGTSLTDANGKATMTLGAGTIEGAGLVTASTSTGETNSIGFATAGDGTSSGGNNLSLIISNSSLDAGNPSIITATFLEADGSPLQDEVINFTSTLGILDPVSGTALTDQNGKATITLAAGIIEGAGVVLATTSSGEADSLGFKTAGDGTELGGNSFNILIDNATIDASNSGTITATFLESDGTPISNEVVTYSSSLGVLDPISRTALTNASGEASILLTAGVIKGAGVVIASVSSGESDKLGFYTNGDGVVSGENSLKITSFTNSTTISDASPAIITVHFEKADGTDLVNEVIYFTSTLGTLDPLIGTALTNSTGEATIKLLAGTVKGAGILTATSADGMTVNQGFSSLGDEVIIIPTKTVGLTISSASVSNATPATLTATVEENGAVVEGEVVTFTSTLGNLDPVIGTAITNASGVATISLTAGTLEGAGIVTVVTATGESANVGFSSLGDEVVVGPETNKLTIVSFTNNTSITNATPSLITVHFEQADGSPLVDEVLSFSSTLGTLNPIIATVLTDTLGNATIDLLAGNVKGAGILTVTSTDGIVASQGFYTAGDGVVSGVNLNLELTNSAGDVVDQISSISSGTLSATVTGVTEAVIVTFSTDIGSIPIQTAIATPASGYVATVELLAGNSLGAGTVTAQLVSGESDQLVFSIGASSLGMGNAIDIVTGLPDGLIEVPSSPISAGATAGLSVGIWDISNASAATPATLFTTEKVEVIFNSGCSESATPTAIIDSPVSTVLGVAQSTYLAQGCEREDLITATANAGGKVLRATGTVEIAQADDGSIEFVSATPENISLKGVGGTENSTVIFKVLDTNGNPSANTDVDFSLNTKVGGTVISPSTAKTDSNGFVQAVVNSGTVHTTVRVIAEVKDSNPSIFTQSNLLVISTGIPDQDSFSLSASENNPEAWDIDGNIVQITARLADAFNNPVPDGTAVSFTAEGGSIEDSCVTANGICSVNWTSQNIRPEGQELGEVNYGPTLVKGTVDISNGLDFTSRAISFSVTSDGAMDTINLNINYQSKFDLLKAVNDQLVNTTVIAASGFEDIFELISTDNTDIEITDIPVSSVSSVSSVNTQDVLGISNGTTYYYDATEVIGSVYLDVGADFSLNTASFEVETVEGTDPITLDTDLGSIGELIKKINDDLAISNVVASEYVYAGLSYLKLTSSERLDIKITNGLGSEVLGITNGTTFATRINNSAPQTTNFMGQKYGGRATISATAIGEESFPDLNGNGRYDEDEEDAFLGKNGNEGVDLNGISFDLAESFVDNNEDNVYNPWAVYDAANPAGYGETGGELEKFDDFNDSKTYNLKDNEYNGSLCGTATNCSTEKSLNVRGSLVLVMSGSHPEFVTKYPLNGDAIDIVSDGTGSASVIIADLHNQPMPAGTLVEFEAAVGSITGISSYTWPNDNRNGGRAFGATVKGVKDQTISGPLTVSVTTPSGLKTIYTVATINITP